MHHPGLACGIEWDVGEGRRHGLVEREDGEARGERNEVNGERTAKAERVTIKLQANRTRERASRIEQGV